MRSSFPESGSRDLSTVEETYAFGEELGAALEAGDVVILDGPLGAGKTTLTQGCLLYTSDAADDVYQV